MAPMINYGELINNLDTSYRWVYSGSVTTPPCAKSVYWNVVARVMPIKEKHYRLFKDIITKKSPTYVTPTGNYRVICKLDKQSPQLMMPNVPSTLTPKSTDKSNTVKKDTSVKTEVKKTT